jgi:hypothetical protein
MVHFSYFVYSLKFCWYIDLERRQGGPVFDSRRGQEDFLFTETRQYWTVKEMWSGSPEEQAIPFSKRLHRLWGHSTVHSVDTRGSFVGINRPGREANHSPAFNAEG